MAAVRITGGATRAWVVIAAFRVILVIREFTGTGCRVAHGRLARRIVAVVAGNGRVLERYAKLIGNVTDHHAVALITVVVSVAVCVVGALTKVIRTEA